MGDTEEARRLQSALGTSPSTIPKQSLSVNPLNISQMRTPMQNFNQNFGVETGKRAGIPPSHPNNIPPFSPYSQIPVSRNANQQLGSQYFGPGLSHSRSLSQSSFFSYDLLPPLSPSTHRDSPATSISDHVLADVSMEDREWKPPSSPFMRGNNDLRACESLPPRNAHRRSNSDIPIGFSNMMQSSPLVMSFRENFGFVKQETSGDSITEGMSERKSEGEVVDDLFSAYMNLDNIDTLNSSGTDEKHMNENSEGLDSRASGTKTNDSSENEAESIVNESGPHMSKSGLKRSAGHFRSVSMDSFMGNMNFGGELTKIPSSNESRSGKLSPGNSVDGNVNSFCLEYGNGEFSGAELKKIMTNDKLAELALSDPKRVKRILANRQSAARSKERKTRYISELEHKVQTLQSETTKLSAQLTHLQRDSAGINSQNNELKFRLQAMEQQAQLREALNEALTAEVQRLEINPKHGVDHQKFQRVQQQSAQLSLQQLQLHEQQNQASQPQLHQNGSTTKQESDQ